MTRTCGSLPSVESSEALTVASLFALIAVVRSSGGPRPSWSAHWRELSEFILPADDGRHHKYRLRDRVEECNREITNDYLRKHRFWKQCLSIFMPRWASRITLEITDVRVERVQEIHYDGIKAEGVLPRHICGGERRVLQDEYFRPLWDSLNASRGYGWDSNPWVWVIEFSPKGTR